MSQLSISSTIRPLSPWSALVSIVDRPRTTFASILRFPRLMWITPVVIAVMALLAFVVVSAPYSSQLAMQQAQQQLGQQGLSAQERQQAMTQTERFTNPTFLAAVGAAGGLVGMGLIWLLSTTVIYVAVLLAGGEVGFGRIFLVVIWAGLATSLRSLVQAALIAATSTFPVYTGLAALQVSGDTLTDQSNPLVALLSFVDPFWIWYIFLLAIGISVAARFGQRKAAAIAILFGLLAAAAGTLPAFFAGSFG